jgi:hypothetical protein
MDEKEMFEQGLQAVYEGRASMKIILMEHLKIIELTPTVIGFGDFEEEDDE